MPRGSCGHRPMMASQKLSENVTALGWVSGMGTALAAQRCWLSAASPGGAVDQGTTRGHPCDLGDSQRSSRFPKPSVVRRGQAFRETQAEVMRSLPTCSQTSIISLPQVLLQGHNSESQAFKRGKL